MQKAEQETTAIESEDYTLEYGKLLITFITDILFSILIFLFPFCIFRTLNLFYKFWDNTPGIFWNHFILLLISFGVICSLIFAIQSIFDFLNKLRIALKYNSKG